jgi:hypothetical protein
MTNELLPVMALCIFLFNKLKILDGKDLMTWKQMNITSQGRNTSNSGTHILNAKGAI